MKFLDLANVFLLRMSYEKKMKKKNVLTPPRAKNRPCSEGLRNSGIKYSKILQFTVSYLGGCKIQLEIFF